MVLKSWFETVILPFKVGNKGGENCDEICDAKCGEKNRGGVFRVPVLLSITVR